MSLYYCVLVLLIRYDIHNCVADLQSLCELDILFKAQSDCLQTMQ